MARKCALRKNAGVELPARCAEPRAYRGPRLLGKQRITRRKRPRPGDVKDVGIAPDLGWKRRVRTSHLDYLRCRQVEDLLAGTAIDDDAVDAAVGTNGNGEQQAPIELLRPRNLGIIEVADALDLEPPILHVAGEAIL